MKAVILAGGYGTRISEESHLKPKPMIEIGGRPILWHIMKIYSHHGINDFVICCGYKGYIIKEYFSNYFLHMADVTLDLAHNTMEVHQSSSEPWKVTLMDTGLDTMTGGRIRRVARHLGGEPFCATYGDGVGDVDIGALLSFHRKSKALATITAVQPPGKFGSMDMDGDRITSFVEKRHGDGGWINGGFFVFEAGVLDYLKDDSTVLERAPFEALAAQGRLVAYRHHGFWQPMDTVRDRTILENMWASGKAPWKLWKD